VTSHPYRDAAADYFAAGWSPLPIRGKWPPPKGWTGTEGAVPSFADVLAWADGPEGEHNVGLRLPAHVLGIDVDAYGGKRGAETLRDHEERLGQLPATWTSTSRTDGASGIMLFIVPEGLHWPGVLPGGDVDVIQARHRYVMAPPSIHPEGRAYHWVNPSGAEFVAQIPHVDDLPNLPQAWIDALTGGKTAADIERADLGDAQASLWLVEHGQGEPCQHMVRAIDRAERELETGTSRHDAAMRATARLGRMVAEGHKGALAALEQVRAAFVRSLGSDREPAGEWQRLVGGAVRIAAIDPVQPLDPCEAGVFGRPLSPFSVPSTLPASPFGALAPQPQGDPWTMTNGSTTFSVDEPSATSTATSTIASLNPAGPSAHGAGPSSSDRDLSAGLTRSSWAPIDLGPILSGAWEAESPVVLARTDGHALFYLGRVNGLIGASESGKTWVALEAVRQELQAGHAVTYVDFEDTAHGVVSRLLALGIASEAILERFAYIGPDEAPGPGQMGELVATLEDARPRLVVLDGFNAAMALAGLEVNSNTDATRFHQGLLKPIMADDRAVVYIDHVSKNKTDESSGGIGAQAKRAMTSGCAVRVDKKDDYGPGVTGYLKLSVDKDRMGRVREFSTDAKWCGEIVITGDHEGGVSIILQPWDPAQAKAAASQAHEGDLVRRVSEFLAQHEGAIATEWVCRAVRGRAEEIRRALSELEAGGFAVMTREGNARRWRSLRAYVEPAFGAPVPFQPEISMSTRPLVPDSSRTSERAGVVDSSHTRPPLRSRGTRDGSDGYSDERVPGGRRDGSPDEIAGLNLGARIRAERDDPQTVDKVGDDRP
jgi:hypothetical protein